jgi:iron complex outermembrane receptor protein
MTGLSKRALGASVAAVALLAGTSVFAQTLSFNVPSEDAAKSIPEFARQAGIQITAPVSGLHGVTTPPIVGQVDVRVALERLIAATGLEIASYQDGKVVLRRRSSAEAPSAESSPAPAAALAEVVVTAQKRATNLQTTPIAISVLGADAITNRHVQSLEDLSDGAIPSLRIVPFGSRNSALTIGMRGIGALADANQPARDQAVGVYIDGVYLGRAQGLGSALYDVERIEVLKGPQGTLFGRNTEGGAISIVTKQPTGEFGMNAAAGFGNFGAYNAEAHVDFPAFHDIAIKVDGLISKRDGTVKNPTTSGQPDFDAYDKRGFATKALWKPTDHFNAEYAFDYAYDGTTPRYFQLLKKGTLPLAPILPVQPDPADTANVGVPLQWSVGQTWGHRLNLDWQLSDALEIKSISSYRKLSQTQFDNGAENLSVFSPNGTFSRYSLANVYQDQYSQEIQFIGRIPRLEYVGGLFYYHEHVNDNAQSPNTLRFNATGTDYTFLSLNLDTVPFDRASHVTSESSGLFGQAVWTPPVLDDKVHLTLGGRFTHDAKNGALDVVNGALPSYVNAAGQTVVGIIRLDKSWDHFDPLVILAYDAAPGLNLYGKWSTGYRAGGANSRSLTYRAFDPETVSMYEVGAKTEFWDRRARLNVSAYYGDQKDVQVDFQVLIPGNNRGTLETTNAATGTTKGFDVDFSVAPMEGLTLSASYAYTDATLSRAFNPFTNALSVVYPTYTPKNAATVAADYEHPAFGAVFAAHIDGNFNDRQYSSSSDPTLSDTGFLVNSRIALRDIRLSNGADMEVSVWSRNLLDKRYVYYRNVNAALGTYGVYNEPRTFGVEARVRY